MVNKIVNVYLKFKEKTYKFSKSFASILSRIHTKGLIPMEKSINESFLIKHGSNKNILYKLIKVYLFKKSIVL